MVEVSLLVSPLATGDEGGKCAPGATLYSRGHYIKAHQFFTELFTTVANKVVTGKGAFVPMSVSEIKHLISVHNWLGYLLAEHLSRPSDGLAHYKAAFNLSGSSADIGRQLHFMNNIAACYVKCMDFAAAIVTYTNALCMALHYQQTDSLLTLTKNSIVPLAAVGAHTDILSACRYGHDLAQAKGDHSSIAYLAEKESHAYGSLVIMHIEAGADPALISSLIHQQLKAIERAIVMCQYLLDLVGVTRLCNHYVYTVCVTHVYSLSYLPRAEELVLRQLGLAAVSNDKYYQSMAYNSQGHLEFLRGRHNLALYHFLNQYGAARDLNDIAGKATAIYHIAKTQIELGQLDGAEMHFHSLIVLSKEAEQPLFSVLAQQGIQRCQQLKAGVPDQNKAAVTTTTTTHITTQVKMDVVATPRDAASFTHPNSTTQRKVTNLFSKERSAFQVVSV